MAEVSHLPLPRDRVLQVVQKTALDSKKIDFLEKLSYPEWVSNGDAHSVKCLQKGRLVGTPKIDENNNYIVEIEKIIAGRRYHVNVVLERQENGEYRLIIVGVEVAVIM